MKKKNQTIIYIILGLTAFLTMVPFIFVINSSLRTNNEVYRSFFGLPQALTSMVRFSWYKISNQEELIQLKVADEQEIHENVRPGEITAKQLTYGQSMKHLWGDLTRGYKYSWKDLRSYMLSTFLVCGVTALGVIVLGSISAYIFSRYKFPGNKLFFMMIISVMMVPAILTLVPSFLLVKKLGLLNSYWVLILPYISGGQIIAIFLFKSFFDGLPESIFESARIDGAGHFTLYLRIILPLSKQVMAVVLIMNILGTWNNFLWPFITNTDSNYHVVASGLYLMGQTQVPSNYGFATLFSAYVISSVPLMLLFIYGTRHFITGITSGAFKA